jgi:hypothetical protein
MARRAGIHELAEAEVIELALTWAEVMAAGRADRPRADSSPELIEADDDTTTIETH